MQTLFKTCYEDDIRMLAKTGEKVRVGLVIAFLIAAPLFLKSYYLAGMPRQDHQAYARNRVHKQ